MRRYYRWRLTIGGFNIILVAGCAGFIGWKTCSLLLEKSEEVVGIDNFNAYHDPKIKERRLNEPNKYPDFSFNRIDISRIEPLNQLFENHNFEAVIDLAARAGVRASVENP